MRIFLIATILFSFGSILVAQKKDIDCQETAQTQAEMNECAKTKSDLADNILNDKVLKLLGKLEKWHKSAQKVNDQKSMDIFDKLKSIFINSQNKWIEYRDLYCDFIKTDCDGGSVAPLQVYSTREELTKQRIKMVEIFMSDNGDE